MFTGEQWWLPSTGDEMKYDAVVLDDSLSCETTRLVKVDFPAYILP